MQKLFIKIKKEKRKERIEKMDNRSKYQNNGYLDARLKKKKEMNKIAYVFLQLFPSLK